MERTRGMIETMIAEERAKGRNVILGGFSQGQSTGSGSDFFVPHCVPAREPDRPLCVIHLFYRRYSDSLHGSANQGDPRGYDRPLWLPPATRHHPSCTSPINLIMAFSPFLHPAQHSLISQPTFRLSRKPRLPSPPRPSPSSSPTAPTTGPSPSTTASRSATFSSGSPMLAGSPARR